MKSTVRGRGAARRGGHSVARATRGLTLVEIMIVMTLLAVMFVALSQSLVGSMALNEANRDSALAQGGLREMAEILDGSGEFGKVFKRYNTDPDDDPPGVTSPGSDFDVAGLEPVGGAPGGRVGQIVFPTLATAAGLELREDLNMPELGMPRDLDGDGAIDDDDHSDDYKLLPVLLRLEWQGANGEQSAVVRTILADR